MTPAEEEREAERAIVGAEETPLSTPTNNANGGGAQSTSDESRQVFLPPPEEQLPLAEPRSVGKFCVTKDGRREIDVTGKELHVFSRAAISASLARVLKEKPAFLAMKVFSNKQDRSVRAIGAASLLEFEEHGQTHTILITNKHNVYKDTKEEEQTTSVILQTQSGEECGLFDARAFGIDSREAGSINLRLDGEGKMAEWEFGHDILGVPVNRITTAVFAALPPFEMVRDDFECEVGQKVGIITWNDQGPDPASVKAGKAMDYDEIEDNFGRRDDVNLYTGEIKFVGAHHIEHDTNTYGGCSGSLIFLLDNHQPDSVLEEDHGKVIAIHVGAKATLPYNIGLKLVGAGTKPLSSYAEMTE